MPCTYKLKTKEPEVSIRQAVPERKIWHCTFDLIFLFGVREKINIWVSLFAPPNQWVFLKKKNLSFLFVSLSCGNHQYYVYSNIIDLKFFLFNHEYVPSTFTVKHPMHPFCFLKYYVW